MKRTHFFGAGVAVAALASLVGACHSSGSNPSVDPACDRYYNALYGELLSCFGGDPNAQANNADRFRLLCERALAAPGTGVTPQWLDNCSSSLSGQSCADIGNLSAGACKTPPGSLADGAPCAGSDQCGAASFCKKLQVTTTSDAGTSTSTPAQCGTCTPLVAVGAKCDGAVDSCAAGSTCTGTTCVASAKVGAGAPCGPATTNVCDKGLTCDFTSKTCAPLGAVGAKCQSTFQCQSTLSCESGACATRPAEGAACAPSGACATGLACAKATKICTKPTYAASGQPCDNNVLRCSVGSCNVTSQTGTGTCPTVLADGAACDKANQGSVCADFASCQNGTCQIPDPSTCK